MAAEHDSAFRACVAEHGPHVVHPCFERGPARAAAVGQAGPPLVEEDEPERTAQTLVELAPVGRLPGVDEVRDEAVDVDEVDAPRPDDLVGDGHVTVPGIADVRLARGQSRRLPAWRPRRPRSGSWSAASGSRPATGSTCARPTRATSSAACRRPAPTRRGGRSTPPRRRCAIRCPRTSGPRSSSASPATSAAATRRPPQTICAEAGKPLKAARVEASRAMSTYTMAAVEARKLAGEVVPMDASQAGEGKLAFTLRVPIGVVGAISPFNFPLNLVAHKIAPALAAGCAGRAEAGLRDAALGAAAGGARAGGRAAAGLAERRRRLRRPRSATSWSTTSASRRSPSPAAATSAGSCSERAPRKQVALELGNATPVIVEADADLEDAAARLAGNALLVRRPELHLGAARSTWSASAYDGFCERFLPQVEALVVGDPADEQTDVGPLIDGDARDRVLEWIAESRRREVLDRRRRDRRRADPADGDRAPRPRREGLVRGGLRPGRARSPRTTRSTRRSSSRTAPATACRPGSSRANVKTALRGRAARSSSAASRSTRRRPSAPTRCPTAASRTPATRARAPRTRCAS